MESFRYGVSNILDTAYWGDLDEIEEVNANSILMANLQQASTSGTQTDNAHVYDSDGSVEVHYYNNCYNNDIFNMFTQEEKYTELLEPIPEPHQVPQNDSNIISEVSSLEQGGGTVEQHPVTIEETRAYFESLDNNLAIEVEKVNTVNRKLRETNADLTTELARYKNEEKCFAISQEKYDKLERCYQKAVYQEQCLTKKINALHLSSGKQITTLNEEIANLNNQLSKEKSIVSSLQEEKKKLKSDFKIREDELHDKQIQLENKIKKLDNILVKTGDLKGKSKDTPCVSDTLDPLSQKLENKNVELEFQLRSNAKIDRVPSASKSSCIKNKDVEVEEHHRNLLLSKNKRHVSSECNNVKLAIRNDKSEVSCAMCKQCLITTNHDVCVLTYVNDMNSGDKKQKENVSKIANQNKHKPQVKKRKKVGSKERLASPTPSKPRSCLRWSPIGRIFDLKGKIITSSESECQSDCSNGDNACTSNPQEPKIKRFPNSTSFLGYGDLQWGNILIIIVYFIEGLGHNLFSVGQFCDLDLEVAFRRNTCFVRNLKGVDLLKGNRTTNLYTINLLEMASASPICLMARATSTKSWLWHQCLSYLNFNTINDLAKNDIVTGLPKFKYHKEHLCPSCEQGKKQKSISPTQTSSKFKAEITLASYGFVWSDESRKHKWETNDREDIGKLGAKGDIGFFIGHSANSCAYRFYNRRTKKIMETVNVTFDELLAMDFE
ncbi:retrovirus-related pol polyprotein from transposon TNT 1-94 [Tanacetum coccineum]